MGLSSRRRHRRERRKEGVRPDLQKQAVEQHVQKYQSMSKTDLQDELDFADLEYKSKDTKNDLVHKLMVNRYGENYTELYQFEAPEDLNDKEEDLDGEAGSEPLSGDEQEVRQAGSESQGEQEEKEAE